MVLWLTSVNWVSYVNVFKPSLKILFLELLPEEYLELTRVVGWKLTAKSWLLRCGEFPPLVLYWVLNKASSNITFNLLNMGIMIMTGIFIVWNCIQNFWWAIQVKWPTCEGLVPLINIRNKKMKSCTQLASRILE